MATLRCSGVMAFAVLLAFVLLLSAPILAMLLLLLLHHQFLPARFAMSVADLDPSPEPIHFVGAATPHLASVIMASAAPKLLDHPMLACTSVAKLNAVPKFLKLTFFYFSQA